MRSLIIILAIALTPALAACEKQKEKAQADKQAKAAERKAKQVEARSRVKLPEGVFVEWTAEVTPAVGPTYQNVGTHVLRIRRGKVSEFLAYEDSQAVADACALMAQAGIDEATAPPITSATAR